MCSVFFKGFHYLWGMIDMHREQWHTITMLVPRMIKFLALLTLTLHIKQTAEKKQIWTYGHAIHDIAINKIIPPPPFLTSPWLATSLKNQLSFHHSQHIIMSLLKKSAASFFCMIKNLIRSLIVVIVMYPGYYHSNNYRSVKPMEGLYSHRSMSSLQFRHK